MKRNAHFGRVWDEIAKIASHHGLLERMEGSLLEAAFGYRLRNNRYREENGVSDVVASRDLKKLCDLDLLVPVGEKRGRYYVANEGLMDIAVRTRDVSKSADPYELVREKLGQLEFGNI